MYYPNYLEFYQVALLQIGPNDSQALVEKGYSTGSNSSHWLIALDGKPKKIKRNVYFTWKVVLFQVNSSGYCLLKQPYYISEEYIEFEAAYTAAREIEKTALADRLISVRQLQY